MDHPAWVSATTMRNITQFNLFILQTQRDEPGIADGIALPFHRQCLSPAHSQPTLQIQHRTPSPMLGTQHMKSGRARGSRACSVARRVLYSLAFPVFQHTLRYWVRVSGCRYISSPARDICGYAHCLYLHSPGTQHHLSIHRDFKDLLKIPAAALARSNQL